MCRLYSLTATHPTRISCELIEAQNSLIRQAELDARGLSNPHGWGIASHDQNGTVRERQVDPAADDEDFRRHAVQLETCTAIAHIRRATVGAPAVSNTHPFIFGDSILAHNGHIPHFETIGARMREAMSAEHREAVEGTTDSEHFFHLLLTHRDRHPDAPMTSVLADTVRRVHAWCSEENGGSKKDSDEQAALNFLWASGHQLAGVRSGRTLWWVATDQACKCPACGQRHANPPVGADYRSIEVASERITSEDWRPVPEHTAFVVTADKTMEFEPLF
jgi:glutamine amidotransferase